jgi:hypothetical protein
MSYDLQIWSVRPVEPSKEAKLSGKDWQIVINESDKIFPEDVDEEISVLLPGIRYLTELNLEGKRTATQVKILHSTAKEAAKRAHGVVADPQSDRVSTPAGVTRYIRPKKEKTFFIYTFSWWFLNDILTRAAGRRAFLALLKKSLPEALPKRYGDYEPPQHVFAKTGMAHLERFIGKNFNDVKVWYTNRPVTVVGLHSPEPLGPSVQGFRTHLLEISVESSVLLQPGWEEQLRSFWRQMTFLLRPFYGELRTEGGYSWGGGAMYQDAKIALQQHYSFTNRSWFWRGVPRKLGRAVVLGKEYQRLWPAFAKHATSEKGFAFASVPEWSKNVELSEIVGSPPTAISLLPGAGMGPKQKYPKIWPFDPPFNVLIE